MEIEGDQTDSTLAAGMLADAGVACVITIGGDGTNRVVVKGCREIPLIPISTGTNNVFPYMVEGTLAGIAAGIIASHIFSLEETCFRAPNLEVRRDGELVDIALVDVVVLDYRFIASRAVWDVSLIREIFLARAEPESIGFSSVGGCLGHLAQDHGKGLHLVVGEGDRLVRAPIGPGLIHSVPIRSHRVFEPEEEIPLMQTPATLALDGERELIVDKGELFAIGIEPKGPWVVDIPRALGLASREGLFLEKKSAV
jgi:hypothetical protein